MSIYETKFCKITYLQKHNAILCQWKQFCKGDDYRKPFEVPDNGEHLHTQNYWRAKC